MITPLIPYAAALTKTQKTRTLVVADLHIGWEIALIKKGIHIPTQMPKLLQKMRDLLSTYKPKKLLILGDVKHTVATAQTGEWQDVPEFFNKLKEQIKEI
ncbi:metallophosphoesterase, partial [Candidatus Bathyarchaeota archaeon]|nr:metallophosphoesterase [Candidatus Bathyarchaeota archaeon]